MMTLSFDTTPFDSTPLPYYIYIYIYMYLSMCVYTYTCAALLEVLPQALRPVAFHTSHCAAEADHVVRVWVGRESVLDTSMFLVVFLGTVFSNLSVALSCCLCLTPVWKTMAKGLDRFLIPLSRHRLNGYLAYWLPSPPGKHTLRN